MLKYLVLAGAFVQILGVISYIRGILHGQIKPNKITWLMWSIAPFIATAAGLSAGVTWSILPVFMSGFGPFLVFLFSFTNKDSYWKLERFDYLCGFLSLVALILWAVTKQPVIAIAFAIASDFSAAVPTLIKAVHHPETESSAPYTTGIFNSVTSFFALKSWIFVEYAFPIYVVCINLALLLSIYWQRLVLKKTAQV